MKRSELAEGTRVRVRIDGGFVCDGEITERSLHNFRVSWGKNREFLRITEDGQIYSPARDCDVQVELVLPEPPPVGARVKYECELCYEEIDQGEVCSDRGACIARQVECGRDPHLARAARDLGMRYHVAWTRLWAGDERVLQARQLAKMTNFCDPYTSTGFRVRGLAQSDAAHQAHEALQRGTDIHMEIKREIKRHLDEIPEDVQAALLSYHTTNKALVRKRRSDEMAATVPSLRASCCSTECKRKGAEPAEHLPSCPVSPVEGLHGGLRVVPASAVPQFTWRGALDFWLLRTRGGFKIRVNAVEPPIEQITLGHIKSAARDAILLDFYLPPKILLVEPDRRLPVDDDPDLQAVADAASRWPGGWK